MILSWRRKLPIALILFLSMSMVSLSLGHSWHLKTARSRAALSATTEEINALLAQLDSNHYFSTIQALAGFGTRYTHSPQILNARDYIQSEFQAVGLPVTLHQLNVGNTTAYNVIATLTSTIRPNEWYIVCGHYDSTSEIPNQSAPGAEDNGSGTAGVIELARVLANEPQQATIKFIAFAGEEQGLVGSNAYVQSLIASGDLSKVQGVINMDMVSYTGDSDLDVLLETSAFAEPMLNILALAAAQFTTLRVEISFNPFGSDHVPFLNNGVKAVLTIENDWDSYPSYHRSSDLPANLTVEMGMQILRMNLAGLAELISGPPTGITVLKPNGGENWPVGSAQPISWTTTGSIANVKVELSRSGSGGPYELLLASTPNDGSETWTVRDASDNNFSITP